MVYHAPSNPIADLRASLENLRSKELAVQDDIKVRRERLAADLVTQAAITDEMAKLNRAIAVLEATCIFDPSTAVT